MILLFGGTSETAPLAEGLAAAGYRVLVSTATEVALNIGDHPNITRRIGRLDEESAIALIKERQIQVIVDSAHPYAAQLHAMANRIASYCHVPLLQYTRPSSLDGTEDVLFADDHEDAARKAFAAARPVLLTTGSRNLEPYLRESLRTGMPLYVRVLPEPESFEACRSAGIGEAFIIADRGPFLVEDNRMLFRKHGIGTIVTKDSGMAGGTPQKLEAARLEGCMVVVVRRPDLPSTKTFTSISALVAELSLVVPVNKHCSAQP